MYESFYKLHPTPFRLTPDPHFFFESKTHKRGLAYLRYAFSQREGFVVVTGAPGTGKTELMLNLINEMPRDKVTLAKIVTSNLDADDLLDLVAASFQIDPDHVSKGSLIKRLEDFFLSQVKLGKHVLLLIDEAHNLSVKSLIELSMLLNFQINEKPLLQCFLLGQEPLEEKLGLPELLHLKQRVIASTHLENLNPQETRDYILHRMVKSSWNNNPIIRDTAFALIHFYTKGVPRKINSMCNRILLQAFLDNRNDIGADLVHHVMEELQEEIAEDHVDLDVDFSSLREIINHDSPFNDEDTTNVDENCDPPDSIKQVPQEQLNTNNVINIPEFIKKKESKLPDKETQNDEVYPESSIHDQSIPLTYNEMQTEESPETSAIQSKATGNEATITKPTNTYQLKHETHVASPIVSEANEQHSTANRPSGLVDKELQFLAKLSESTGYAGKSTRQKDKSNQNKDNRDADKTPVKKVIIDESVYGDYGINEANLANEHPDTSHSPTREKHQLQSMAAAIIVLTAIVVSIYRWYDGEADIIDQTASTKPEVTETEKTYNAKNDGEKFLAKTETLEIAIPTIPIPNPVFPSFDGTQSDLAATTKIEQKDIQEEVKLAAVSSPSIANKSPVQNTAPFSDADESDKINKLDQQITEILEKPNLETNITIPNATAKANEREKPGAGIKLADSNSNKAGNASVATVTNNSLSPENKNNKETNLTNAEHTQPPIVGSPVAETTVLANQNQQNDSPLDKFRISQTNTTAAPQPTRSSTRGVVKTRNIPFITNSDLRTLVDNLSTAYETGNLQKLVSTFASDIYSSDGSNRQQLESDYQRLFDVTDTRRLAIRDVKWLKKDKQMLGNGDFQVMIREKGATSYTTYEGKIRFTVAKESNNIVIKKLDYDYNN